MIIDIGNGVDESVVKWKYNDKDKWHDADIDDLIHLYESVVHCKDCIRNNDGNFCDIAFFINDDGDGFCNCGERREE